MRITMLPLTHVILSHVISHGPAVNEKREKKKISKNGIINKRAIGRGDFARFSWSTEFGVDEFRSKFRVMDSDFRG